jgi:hypothetical protein
VILRTLWSQIEDVGLKEYVGFTDDLLRVLEGMALITITPPKFDTVVVPFVFLGGEQEHVERALQYAEVLLQRDGESCSSIYCLPVEWYSSFLRMLRCVEEKYNVLNLTAKMLKICEIVQEHCLAENSSEET